MCVTGCFVVLVVLRCVLFVVNARCFGVCCAVCVDVLMLFGLIYGKCCCSLGYVCVCCVLLFVVVCCCSLLFVVVCCCLLCFVVVRWC